MPTTKLAGLTLFLFQVFSGMQSVEGASVQRPRVEPWKGPDILGKIEEITRSDSGPGPDIGTILVKANGRHRAYLTIDDKRIVAAYRSELSFIDLRVGQQVAVWFRSGPRYPVFPIRTSAARVAVIEDSSAGSTIEKPPPARCYSSRRQCPGKEADPPGRTRLSPGGRERRSAGDCHPPSPHQRGRADRGGPRRPRCTSAPAGGGGCGVAVVLSSDLLGRLSCCGHRGGCRSLPAVVGLM